MKIIRRTRRDALAQAFAEPPTIEEEIEYRKLIVVEELLQFMKRNGISRSELAERMGVVPSRITAMLNGTSNLTIDTLVRAGRAVGADLQQTYVPQGQKGVWRAYTPPVARGDNCIAFDPASSVTQVARARTPKLTGNPKPAERDAEDAA